MKPQKTYGIHFQGKKGKGVMLSLSDRLETENLKAFLADAKKIMGLIDRKALAMEPLISNQKSSNPIEQIVETSLDIEPLEAQTDEGLAQSMSKAMERFSRQVMTDLSKATFR
jgi:hypothetical protein